MTSRRVIVICPHFRAFYPLLHQPLAVGSRLECLDSQKFRFRPVVGIKYFIFSTPFRPAPGHTQSFIHFGTRRYFFAVNVPEFPSKHSLPSSAKVKNVGAIPHLPHISRSQSSLVFIVSKAMAWNVRSSNPGGAIDSSLLQTLRPTGSGAHPTSYSLITGVLSRG